MRRRGNCDGAKTRVTAITINLLVEEQLSQQAQARDPFKISIIIGAVLTTISAALISYFTSYERSERVAVA